MLDVLIAKMQCKQIGYSHPVTSKERLHACTRELGVLRLKNPDVDPSYYRSPATTKSIARTATVLDPPSLLPALPCASNGLPPPLWPLPPFGVDCALDELEVPDCEGVLDVSYAIAELLIGALVVVVSTVLWLADAEFVVVESTLLETEVDVDEVVSGTTTTGTVALEVTASVVVALLVADATELLLGASP